MTQIELLNKIRQEIERRKGYISVTHFAEELLSFLDTLQEPIKVYRVENEAEQKGLWRKFDGTWEPLFNMLTDGQCRNMPMDDNDIYHAEGLRWFASAPSTKTLQKWFSKKDLEELTAAGFTITEFTISRYKVLSEFEYIFPREYIITTRHLSVRDIYPDTLQEPEHGLDVTEFCKPIDPDIAKVLPDVINELTWGEQEPEVDLEEEADRMFFSLGWYEGDHHQPMLDCVSLEQFRGIARHFYELGKNAK